MYGLHDRCPPRRWPDRMIGSARAAQECPNRARERPQAFRTYYACLWPVVCGVISEFQRVEHLGGVPECMRNKEGKRQSRAMNIRGRRMVHTSASRPNASSFSVSQDSKSKLLLLSVVISSEWARLLIKWEWGCGWVCWSSTLRACAGMQRDSPHTKTP